MRRKRWARELLVVFLVVLTLPAALLEAHDFSASYSRIQVEGTTVQIQLTLNLAGLQDAARLDRDGDGKISATEFAAASDSISDQLKANFVVGQPEAPDKLEAPLDIRVSGYDFLTDNVVQLHLVYTFAQPVKRLRVVSSLDRMTKADHTHILQFGDGSDMREAVLDRTSPTVDIDIQGRSAFKTIADFVKLGVFHIFTGYDHLSFLVGLLLMSRTLRALAKVITSFTVAHSISLALATLGIVSLPPRLIESAIALSIAYIAIENVSGHTLTARWKMTFLFGLVHGFGFSNVLKEMALTRQTLAISLFSFNGGVEIGQLLFIGALFPIVSWVAASRWKRQAFAAASLAIMSLGMFWFVQRAFFS